MIIVTDDKIPFLRGVLEPWAEVRYLPGAKIGPDEVKEASALITRTRTRVDARLLQDSTLKFIATATIGTDHLDIAAIEAKGLAWTSAPGCNAESVAQWFTSALVRLHLDRGLSWQGKTLGIVGCGNVGKRIAVKARALGMEILLNDPPRARAEGPAGFVDFDQILKRSDFITLHVPLERSGPDRTLGLFDDAVFARMKSGAVIFNSCRGEVIVEPALRKALGKGLSAAVLDVWDPEPVIDSESLAAAAFATPHIAGYSVDGKAKGTAMSVQALARHFGIDELADWSPRQVPAPKTPIIDLRELRDPIDIICHAVLATYDIAEDDARLRADPASFEALRGAYPPRREFAAHQVLLPAGSPAASALKEMGFGISK
ncbi:MAG: hypothetical protein RL095_1677 [Verrucomicrobiota bacterium]|jgi:erythronate-4-phosphate dehydrogenase